MPGLSLPQRRATGPLRSQVIDIFRILLPLTGALLALRVCKPSVSDVKCAERSRALDQRERRQEISPRLLPSHPQWRSVLHCHCSGAYRPCR